MFKRVCLLQVLKANGPLHTFFFMIVIFLCSFYVVNLILAIVAMSYDDCRRCEKEEIEAEYAAALVRTDICRSAGLHLLYLSTKLKHIQYSSAL